MKNNTDSIHLDILSENDMYKFKKSILSISGSLVCLLSALIYSYFFPEQEIINAFIFLLGILIIGIPVLITAIKGLLSKNTKAALEILVSIAMIISALSGEFILAIVIPLILTFVHFLEEKSIMGGRDAIEGLKKMQAETAIILRDNSETEVDARDLKCDDIIMVKPGMALPVDGEVIFGISNMDERSLTGEPLPKTVKLHDQVFAGTVNIDGHIQVKVTNEYSDSSFRKIVRLLEEAEEIAIPETKIIDKFIFYYIPLVLVIAFLVWIFSQDITRAIAILVASCPIGHLLISSAPMIAAIARASKNGILIKNSAFLEYLPETDYIIFDKTGTLTKGILEAESFYLHKAESYEELLKTASELSHASLHPISRSIISLCDNIIINKDYEVKEYIGKGLEGRKGEEKIYLASYSWASELGFKVPDKYEDAGTCLWILRNSDILGCIIFKDIPREDAGEIIKELKKTGIKTTCLLTGDRLLTAKKIQKELGIDEMYHELLPQQKLAMVNKFMENNIVTVVGDGINDALALSSSHAGIAMGAMGSDTAINSADIALMNNNLENIPFAIKLAQKTKGIIYQNIVFAFSLSVIMILLAAMGIVSPITGALLHNLGALLILFNSSRLARYIQL